MYSWTQASLGSAQTCRPLLLRKLWSRWRGDTLRHPAGEPGPTMPPPSSFALTSRGQPALSGILGLSQARELPSLTQGAPQRILPSPHHLPSLPSLQAGPAALTQQALGQVRSHLRDLGPEHLIGCPRGWSPSRMAPRGHCLHATPSHSPEVGRKAGTHMTPGLEHWLLVS